VAPGGIPLRLGKQGESRKQEEGRRYGGLGRLVDGKMKNTKVSGIVGAEF